MSADPPTRNSRRALLAASAAFVLATLVGALSTALRHKQPFGPEPRNTNDLGQQFIPMYAYVRDVLTGQADGGLLFSWQSGHGTPFLGDALAYVGTSFSWLTLLLPRDRIDLTLFLVFLCALGSAAAAMTVLLLRLRPSGPAWLAVAGGVAYGAGAWSLETAYMTTWLNGVVAFPLLCLVVDSAMRRWSGRVLLLAPPLVAFIWTWHFYTVYMATIGAAVFALARGMTLPGPWRDKALGLLRAGLVVGLGLGLVATVLLPVQRLVAGATPSAPAVFTPADWATFLARLLPGTAGVAATPAIGAGVLFLVLAVSLVLNGRVPRAERVVWPLVLVLVVVSMQIPVTHLVWHAFDTPNGNPYRQSFVTIGFVVLVGWFSGASGLRWRPALVGAAGVVALLVATHGQPDRTPWTVPLTLGSLALLAVAAGVRRVGRTDRGRRGLLGAGLLVLVVTAEATASGVVIDQQRSQVLHAYSPWNAVDDRARALVQEADSWPEGRTDPGTVTSANDPMLLGGQGSEYYSSTIQLATTTTLTHLGWGYSSYGRALVDPENPVTDAIFDVRARVVEPAAPGAVVSDGSPQERAARLRLLRRARTAPLVRVMPGAPTPTADTVWRRHEQLLGAPLYEVPERRMSMEAGVRAAPRRDGDVILRPPPGARTAEVALTGRCTPGSTVYLASPALVAEYRKAGSWVPALPQNATRPGVYTGMAIREVGTVGPDGALEIRLRIGPLPARLGPAPLACLPPGRLEAAVTALRPRAATGVDVGSRSISFDVPAGSGTRTAVIATPRLTGWSCSGAVTSTRPTAQTGLLAVALGPRGGTVSCSYRPPGARLGLLVGAVTAAAWLLLAGALALRRRRAGSPGRARTGHPSTIGNLVQ